MTKRLVLSGTGTLSRHLFLTAGLIQNLILSRVSS